MAKVIDHFKDDYFYLSNYYVCSVEYEGLTYRSSEAAFQAAKIKLGTPEDTNRARESVGFTVCGAGTAKRKGQEVNLRSDWEAVKDDVMLEIVRNKFKMHKDLAKQLIETGDAVLIEGTTGWHDNYWGTCSCPKCINIKGKNHLGIILMQVRAELQKGV